MSETSTSDADTGCGMPPRVEPQAEHRWLDKLVGQWRLVSFDDKETGEQAWTENVRSLNGLWIVAESTGPLPDGGRAIAITTLGYDPNRGRYVGTWLGTMMTHMFVYEGTLDESGRVLSLDCEGPDFTAPGRMARYRDIITIEDDDTRTLTGTMQRPDGSWKSLMTARYQRVR